MRPTCFWVVHERPDGIEALCDDLAVSPTDIRVLLLAWKLQAGRQGYFSLDEWRKGMKAMQVDSVDKHKKALPGLQQDV
jgi:DCN1-like protein 4/5